MDINGNGRKSFADISLKISEEEYRADSALSYSTIAKFDREVFNNLSTLFQKVESPSLLFGSCVDTLITGSQEEFDSLYMVADFPELPDKQKLVIEHIFHTIVNKIPWENIDTQVFEDAVEFVGYQSNWRLDTRVRVIKEVGKEYYDLLTLAEEKKVISQSLYKDVINCVESLKTSSATSWYFQQDNPFDTSIERLYQLKFKGEYEGIPLRIMADEIIVNHKDKTILPIDLKTSSKKEWDFPKSFIEWKYYHQAQLYAEIIKQNIMKDDYFKDFKILPYRFIVINRYSLVPLVWEFEETFSMKGCTLRDKYYKGWREVVKELNFYLKNNPQVPINIKKSNINSIEDYFKENE